MAKKTKEIKLPVEFNVGTMKYEPLLPLRKIREGVKKRIELRDIIALIIMLIIVGIIGALLIYYKAF